MANETESPDPITLDFTGLKEVLVQVNKDQVQRLQEAFKRERETTSARAWYSLPKEQAEKIVESLHHVHEDKWKMEEQWTVAIPNYRYNEPKAHLRDYVWTQEVLKTEQGDVLNIPYVRDFTFQQLGAVGNAITGTLTDTTAATALINFVSTTLYEAGAVAELNYYLLEKFDSNLLDLVNTAFADAAVRSEDTKIMTLINALSSTNFAGNVSTSPGGTVLYNLGVKNFYSANISAGLKLLLNAGKDVKPQDCLLYLTPSAYGALVAEIMASQVIAFAAPTMITQGVIEALFGVKIVVGAYITKHPRTAGATGTVDVCYMMRSKRAVCLAPKRDILIETQKQIATRKLRIVASHTFGIYLLDWKEIVRIWCNKRET